MRSLLLLAFLCTTVLAAQDGKRSDDANNVAALETLLQKQAATIQTLQARLDAQDSKILQQAATLHDHQADLAAQQNTLDTVLRNNQLLEHRMAAMETAHQQQSSTVQSLQTSLQRQENTLQQQEYMLQTMNAKINKQEQTAGFHADFGQKPYATFTPAVNSSVLFNRVLTNVGNGYDQKTGIFTAPFSGLYTFHLHFIGGLHNGSTDLGLYAGGQVIAVAFAEGENKDDNDQGSCTAVVDLLRGEEVSVKFYYGNPQIWGSRLTSFSGMLIHSD